MAEYLTCFIEAIEEGKEGIVNVSFTVKDRKVEFCIKDVVTEITLLFPEYDPPKLFSDKIVLSKGDIVIIMEDNPLVYDACKRRFEKYSNDITIKYFTDDQKTIDLVNSFKAKDKIFWLADYELRG